MKYVSKWFDTEEGKCGKWIANEDVRGYPCPKGYTAIADCIEYHPITEKYMARSEWWIFLTRTRR